MRKSRLLNSKGNTGPLVTLITESCNHAGTTRSEAGNIGKYQGGHVTPIDQEEKA